MWRFFLVPVFGAVFSLALFSSAWAQSDAKLDQVLKNQEMILAKLDQVMEELRIVKVRATLQS